MNLEPTRSFRLHQYESYFPLVPHDALLRSFFLSFLLVYLRQRDMQLSNDRAAQDERRVNASPTRGVKLPATFGRYGFIFVDKSVLTTG